MYGPFLNMTRSTKQVGPHTWQQYYYLFFQLLDRFMLADSTVALIPNTCCNAPFSTMSRSIIDVYGRTSLVFYPVNIQSMISQGPSLARYSAHYNTNIPGTLE